ncbi:expressed unknown protein [Ectocarpus siliculosus]|uniref:Uncharacterized protein n=1 Tax=Ectocarpus siliculosus TaxID=2880 RepID=D7FLF4_ECTSI|nr:expressed unknown protein [Ectocarpus siliculosus]|eukprot:CBJ29722.1 expressed unknown protein [Ectocarpus siliculosus]
MRGAQGREGRVSSRVRSNILLRPAAAGFWAIMLLVIPGEKPFGCASTAGQTSGKEGEYDSGYDVSRRNMIKAIADLYKEEMRRQEDMSMEDAILCDNGPKEISIFFHENPEVKIVDLAQDHRNNNDCLVLNINSPDVSSKVVLKCDGSISGDDFGWGEDW